MIDTLMRIITLLIILLLSSPAGSEELPIFFDAGIDAFKLESRDSTLTLLQGKAVLDDCCGFRTYQFQLGATHLIQFISHPGNYKYEASEIKIIRTQKRTKSSAYPGKAVTQKGISLGMSKEELIRKIGKPMIAGPDEYEYRIINHEGIVRIYNMPIYYGKYKFVNNKLDSLSFGFENP